MKAWFGVILAGALGAAAGCRDKGAAPGEDPSEQGGADCDPDDPLVHPCSSTEVAGDSVDHDCDGEDGRRTEPCPQADPDFPDVEPMTCPGA